MYMIYLFIFFFFACKDYLSRSTKPTLKSQGSWPPNPLTFAIVNWVTLNPLVVTIKSLTTKNCPILDLI